MIKGHILYGLNRRNKIAILLFLDIAVIILSYYISFLVTSVGKDTTLLVDILKAMPLIILIYVTLLWIFKMYKSIWSKAGSYEVATSIKATVIASIINILGMTCILGTLIIKLSVLASIFIIALTTLTRMSIRILRRATLFTALNNVEGKYNTLIIGAGDCALAIINEIRKEKGKEYNIIGIIDDDINKKDTFLNGVKVIGGREKIADIAKERNVEVILFAIAKIDLAEKTKLIDICNSTSAKVKILPGYYELLDNEISMNKMRDIDLKDLIGREEVQLDKEGIEEYINNKVVLVTGGGGSIGSELCRQIAKFNPKLLLILDIYENNAYDLQNELSATEPELNKKIIIASVRDKYRMSQVISAYKPNIIFHAAAHKHVPLMEDNPSEAIKNNVIGTLNVAQLASQYKVDKFVLISTDKAVNPTNVMGATKRLCEMIVQAVNSERGNKTDFVAVRFGNVLGSNGSVIPLFKRQIKNGGPLTLTHNDITRYFMLIPEAAQLVLQAGAYARGGEVFVLDMGSPVKIYDLAENLIKLSGYTPNKDIKIKVTGLRPGEKLYEELLMNNDNLTKTAHNKIFIDKPESLSLNNITKQIDDLMFITKLGNKNMLINKLREIVPTYNSPEFYNSKINRVCDEVAVGGYSNGKSKG